MKVEFVGAPPPGKHAHKPERFQKLTHSGMLTECAVCGRFITYVQPKRGNPFWRLR